jgi:CHAD domain-containing protein
MTKTKKNAVALGFDGQSLARALSSAINHEFDATIQTCQSGDDPAERVHSARKHLKRFRALIRLLPPASEKKLLRTSRVVRLVARRLGGVRDAVAQLDTWRKFNESEPRRGQQPGATDPIAERLEQFAKEQLERGLVERRMQRAARALQAARAEVQLASAASAKSEQKSLRALTSALRRSYRKARFALRGARSNCNAETLHTLRRANKAYQYQLQFLEPAWPKLLKAQRLEAAQLSDDLGEHHDLAVLADSANPEAQSLAGLDESRLRLMGWQRELERKALCSAALVYSEKPRALQRRLLGYLRLERGASDCSETQ